MEVDYEYQTDYAKSGRSCCTKCRENIGQGTLRIGKLIQAANFDGKIPKWFHFSCFFTKNAKIQSVSEIKHFDSLRWEDQEKIREHINPSGTPDPLPKFSVKLSSPVGQCSACKSELLKERHMIVADKRDAVYYHLSCFLRRPDCPADITTLTGFKKLKKVDRDAIVMAQAQASKENLKRPNSNVADGPVVKKPKKESDVDKKKEALRLQSKRLWTMHDKLETEVSKDALIGLLEYNDQHVPAGLSNLLDAVSDAMVFGALTTCPSCKNGPLRYSNGQYKCSAMATEWAPCLYHTRDPERKPFKVPEEYFDVEFLKNYKYVKRTRLFDAEAVPLGDGGLAGPFSGDMIFIDGGSYSNGKTKEQLATELKTLGASVKDRVEGCTLALTSRAGFEQLTSRVRSRLEELRIRVVSDEILSQFPDKTVAMSASRMSDILEKYTLSKWTPLPRDRGGRRAEPYFESSSDSDSVMHCTLKGGAMVDPESGLTKKASVMKDTNQKPMTAVLGMVDIVKGANSFYKLQALQSDNGVGFWLFRAWGRIGTSIGGTKLEKFTTAKAAREAFEYLYLDKTGNNWKDRTNFQKKPHKFYEMELDYGEAEEKSKQVVNSQPSKLHPALQSLIQFICDIESMKRAMVEFDLDLKKMPLGKLSRRQILEAYGILGNLSKMIDRAARKKTEVDQTMLLSESTRFFTLIPHDFGMKAPPLLDSRKAIKTKLQMLEDLLEIELAYNMLKERGKGNENPLDQHYKQLHTSLKPLDPNEEEYKRIVDYVKLTHGSTHTSYKLEVVSIFDVERPDEKVRFNGYKPAQHNKMLLWHGSRRTNWVGILSQGLRIAPPEAPVTGYMFGKGIYFADMCSKSANYCFTSHSQPDGVLLLCEVILGDIKECKNAEGTPLPDGMNSRKGCGSVIPDPSTYYTNAEGVVYPIGKPVPSNTTDTSLIYNEYIVYDVAQVKQKYLVRVKFHFDH